MNPNDSLIVAPSVQVEPVKFTPAALALKETALASAALIGKVTNADENTLAVRAQQEIRNVQSLFEKARKAAKEPILQRGRMLDSAVSAQLVELDKEFGRITALVSDFQLAERRRVAEEQRIQQEELARIEREKQAELARIAAEQAEVERKAREAREAAERAAAEAKNKKQREAAEAARIEAERLAQAACERAAASQAQSAAVTEKAAEKSIIQGQPIEATRVTGQQVRTDWEITVLNPYELAKFHPDCVKIEPLLGPIKAALNEGRTVKGIRAEKKTVATVRLSPQRTAIDI